jgi:hypothetical protein
MGKNGKDIEELYTQLGLLESAAGPAASTLRFTKSREAFALSFDVVWSHNTLPLPRATGSK